MTVVMRTGRSAAGSNGASQQQAEPSGRGLLLELQDVCFGYDTKRPVLEGLSLTVERGTVRISPSLKTCLRVLHAIGLSSTH